MKRKTKADKNYIGELMSNVLFNFAQQDRFTQDERKMMKALQAKWDAATTREPRKKAKS